MRPHYSTSTPPSHARRSRLVRPQRMTALAAALLATLGGALAQQAPPESPTPGAIPAAPAQAASTTLQRVEVTGSNIRRVDAETAAPIQTLTREDIEKSGKASVAELLQSLAVDNQGSVPMTFGNGFAHGASGISLRGLGAASTLVLINGRRIAPYGMADDGQKIFADLNVIPLEAVERVEVLKDGASAIYGSDAIAGVVNVILRKDFRGTVVKANVGQSRYRDGTQRSASITHGRGDPDADGYNLLFNLELGKTDAIWNRDRAGRGQVGSSDGRAAGFDANGTVGGGSAVGAGAITGGGQGSNAGPINGNVRNPATGVYANRGNLAGAGFTRTFPDANCANFSGGYSQAGSGGGCLIDAQQRYAQIQPSEERLNFFTRGNRQLRPDLNLYAELNWVTTKSRTESTPSTISASTGFPGGPVANTGVSLGANHPDNPYFGQTAVARYLAGDVGPRTSDSQSDFARFVTGLKGTFQAWDYDTAFLYSQTKGTDTRNGYLQRDVAFALLNPTAANVATASANSAAYAALPAGSFWRIAENAGLNSRALYAALSPSISSSSRTALAQLDFKASRELGQLAGGPVGFALGAELRRETTELTPSSGTERGNIIGLGYSAYKGERNVVAAFAEGLFPVSPVLELNAALRADHYSDTGNSLTPKIGAKWKPAGGLVLRATYAEGFRAPGAAENGVGGVAAFATAVDPLRCNLGVQTACSPGQVALITTPNRNLKPERSQSASLGAIWEPTPDASLSVDLWQIVRRDEINQELSDAAVAAGHVARDPGTAQLPGDPGQITAILLNYVNSARTTVRGLDFDGRQRIQLGGGSGQLVFDAKWTHLFKWLRREADGAEFDYAGTHGNCDVSNCAGTPADKVNLSATWEVGPWRIAGLVNYRGPMENKLFKNDPAGCASSTASGVDAPSGCKVSAFTTLDLNLRYKVNAQTELFAGIRNVFDAIPPFDPLTYGATGYNPTDYLGAVGRFFNVGLRHQF